MPCEVQALGALMSQGGHAFIPAAHLCVLRILALKPHLPGSWRVGSILLRAHQHQLFPWQAQPWALITEGWGGIPMPTGDPVSCCSADLSAWHDKNAMHLHN